MSTSASAAGGGDRNPWPGGPAAGAGLPFDGRSFPGAAQRRYLLWAATGLGGALAWWVLGHWVPPDGVEHSVCMFRRLTSTPCPGCGLTRAFAHLAKGEVGAALAMHPLAPLAAVEAVLAWLWWGASLVAAPPRPSPRWLAGLASVHLAALLLLWVGRLVTGTLPP